IFFVGLLKVVLPIAEDVIDFKSRFHNNKEELGRVRYWRKLPSFVDAYLCFEVDAIRCAFGILWTGLITRPKKHTKIEVDDHSQLAVSTALWCNFLVFSLKFGVWIATSS
ncbi:hypothetical protein M8C21_016639, partial [Ambrosia artemisiifolia]